MKGSIKKYVGTRGVSYIVTVDLPRDPETGKRRQQRRSFATKKEADAYLAKTVHEIGTGNFSEADAQKITVEQYLTRWLESIGQTVRPITQRRYADLIRLHVTPEIGKIRLSKLAPLDLERLYADRHTKGKLSSTTISNIHVILHKALKQAVRWQLLTRNVTEAVTPPRKASPKNTAWTKEQTNAFLSVADNDDLAALWRLELLTGVRRGELLGLKWEDVDFGRKAISIKRTYSRGVAGGFELGELKTQKARRSIALPDSVLKALQKHRAHQTEHKWKLGEAYKDQGMVFATPEGNPIHPNTLRRRFLELVEAADIPKIRIHDMRHTSATLMLANNVHPKIVQERLGHSDISMTMNLYSHVTMDMQREAADKMDSVIGGSS